MWKEKEREKEVEREIVELDALKSQAFYAYEDQRLMLKRDPVKHCKSKRDNGPPVNHQKSHRMH